MKAEQGHPEAVAELAQLVDPENLAFFEAFSILDRSRKWLPGMEKPIPMAIETSEVQAFCDLHGWSCRPRFLRCVMAMDAVMREHYAKR